MALLRWIYLRKLVPIEDLIAGAVRRRPAAATAGASRAESAVRPSHGAARAPAVRDRQSPPCAVAAPLATASPSDEPSAPATPSSERRRCRAPSRPSRRRAAATSSRTRCSPRSEGAKAVFYNTVVAQAQTIDVAGDRVTFTFSAAQRALRDMFEQNRAWLESIAQQVAGPADRRRACARGADGGRPARPTRRPADAATADKKSALREQALADAGVQALLEVFPAEIRDVGGNVNIQQMMKQAQQMQERLQKQMAELRVEATAGGGMVTVVVNGAKQVQSLKIDPEVVSKEDVEMLQDLIVAAVNDAHRKADEEMSQKMGGMLPPGIEACPASMLTSPCRSPIRSSGSSRSCSACPASARRARSGSRSTSSRRRASRPSGSSTRVRDVKERVTYCSVCNNITDADPCAFCRSDARDHHDHLRRRGAAERRRRSRRRASSRASITC